MGPIKVSAWGFLPNRYAVRVRHSGNQAIVEAKP